jgi:hypothetical protein
VACLLQSAAGERLRDRLRRCIVSKGGGGCHKASSVLPRQLIDYYDARTKVHMAPVPERTRALPTTVAPGSAPLVPMANAWESVVPR